MRRDRPESENPDLLAQDGVSGGIEELPGRVDRYGKAKNTALDVAKYIGGSEQAQELSKQHQRLSTCGDYLVFRHYFTVDQVKLHGARPVSYTHLTLPTNREV